MYVGALEAVAGNVGDNWWTTVTVTVVDVDNDPVSGAIVGGVWSNGYGETTCTTGGNGQCNLTSKQIEKGDTVFTVDGVSHDVLVFNPNRTFDDEGNLYGRSIKVKRPDDHATPEPTPEITPEPTETPTPGPTPEPTEEPTPAPGRGTRR
jgi:hypothetical protein